MRWPSLRSAISSTSQIERSSSHTRMLAMRHLRQRGLCAALRLLRRLCLLDLDPELGAFAGRGPHRDLAVVRLHDLVNDRQTQSGAALKPRLVGLKDFFDLLWRQAA